MSMTGGNNPPPNGKVKPSPPRRPAPDGLPARVKELRADRTRHALSRQRAAEVTGDVRERWTSGRLDLAQKRALIREALHAVIVLPVGGGGRRPFNPDLLVPKWRD
ncbi:hypothetical protein OHB36_03215 [Streptomyces sp. NBC_00320]|uniref:hypothetical protein n=1 Tax=Streptomyces sp. NBC_00320 TaxID=2975711 RepID=UPI00225A48DF|nr:hypothetical protein [Streptomyces sp. NBC_00320]MCX5145798.1 hypothetical protein [Streptomyces sp. NBC_00320]